MSTPEQERRAKPDAVVTVHGSLVLIDLRTRAASRWVADNVDGEAQFFAGSLVVEPRYLEALVIGMRECGLVVA